MSRKKAHHEEHADETWLLPYSDLLTLLLALFIVMFAMSKIDNEKFENAREQFNVIFSGGSGMMEKDGTSIIPLHNVGVLESESGSTVSNTAMEEDKMTEIKEKIEEEIKASGYSDRVKVVLNNEGLEITIQDAVLFNSGDAEVLSSVYPMLLHISKILNALDNNIKIVGHTDDVPISTRKFRSNWDLSAIRAINVMTFLVEQGGLNPERFSIQGYGQYLPKYENSTETGRAKNRRVEIFLIRKYPLNDENTDSKEK